MKSPESWFDLMSADERQRFIRRVMKILLTIFGVMTIFGLIALFALPWIR